MSFFRSPQFLGPRAGTAERSAVVLVNLGTPDAPTPAAVRRYLAQFLWDPRVIEAPRWLWWLVLRAILLLRPRRSAHAYATIWTPQGSPLLVLTRELAVRLGERLGRTVEIGMRYGQPDLGDVLRRLAQEGVRRLVLVPLYPQYSGTSTGAVLDALADASKTLRWPPEVRVVGDYHTHPVYIEALARSVEAHWRSHGQAERVLLSFHGIPQRYVAAGDPYLAQCRATAEALGRRLSLPPERLLVAFQSRVGREPWLTPYTDNVLRELPGQGVRSVQVLCPGFAVDCLETLEEIALQNRDLFLSAGGERYEYMPCLNASDDHVDVMAALVAQAARGWADFALDS